MRFDSDYITSMKFFEPDVAFLKWIKEYANGRLVIDCGAGMGHVTRELFKLGTKVVAFEPNGDYTAFQEENMKQRIGMIQYIIADCSTSKITSMPNLLLLFCRPCHSDFVERTIAHMHPSSEALYITKPNNWEDYDDLGHFRDNAVLIKHKGKSKEGEKVWSIKKSK
jgi:hypothetical protein